MLISPVSACHDWNIFKTGVGGCAGEDITYTITVGVTDGQGQTIHLVDTLPPGVTYKSSTDGGSENAGVVTWNIYVNAQGVWSKSVSVTVEAPATPQILTNVAKYYANDGKYHTASFVYAVEPCDTTNAPEFPSIALPVGMIIGLLGVVLFIRGTREN